MPMAGAAMVMVAAAGASTQGMGDWRQVTGPPELSFPRDHGAHFDYRTEWWYVTGLVTAADGARFGFQITFFRQGLAPGVGVGALGVEGDQCVGPGMGHEVARAGP